MRILAGVDALLFPSFRLGAHCAAAAILTAVPECCVELLHSGQEEGHRRAKRLHDNLLGALERNRSPEYSSDREHRAQASRA